MKLKPKPKSKSKPFDQVEIKMIIDMKTGEMMTLTKPYMESKYLPEILEHISQKMRLSLANKLVNTYKIDDKVN